MEYSNIVSILIFIGLNTYSEYIFSESIRVGRVSSLKNVASSRLGLDRVLF